MDCDKSSRNKQGMDNSFKISERELEVLQLIALGHTSQTIADQLYISRGTVDSHRKSLFAKLQVNNMASLINRAYQMRYLRVEATAKSNNC